MRPTGARRCALRRKWNPTSTGSPSGKRGRMTEFFTIKHIDNSRLVRTMAPNRMRECARLVLLGGLIALCAFLYAWQHFQAIQLRYQLESLRGERSQAAELNQELKFEVAARLARPRA